jgi:hypothetical protein
MPNRLLSQYPYQQFKTIGEFADGGQTGHTDPVPLYSHDAVTARIAQAMEAKRVRARELYEMLGIAKPQWYLKMGGEKNHFNFDEISRIASHLGAPPGWPFIDWELADANVRAATALGRMSPALSPEQELVRHEGTTEPGARPEYTAPPPGDAVPGKKKKP